MITSTLLSALAVDFAIGIKLVGVVGIWFCQSQPFWLDPFPPIIRAVAKTPALPECRICWDFELRFGCFCRLRYSYFLQTVSIPTARIIDHSLSSAEKAG